MPSQFGWVDFAEEDRQQMLNVVNLFRERETRDELGIGTIRDAFADYFFPGTSTVQTRVRYMLFIPWIYQDLEQRRIQSDEIARRARQAEVKLIYALLDSEGKDQGVLGQDAKDKLKRLPSSIYWAGLGAWGIRRFQGSQDQYHRFIGSARQRRSQSQLFEAEVDQEIALSKDQNWDPGLPKAPKGFPDKATLALRLKDAQYFQERIYLHHRNSLLAHLVTEANWVEVDFFWEHPLVEQIPKGLRQDVLHAQNFSETIYGAALLYNLLLARKGNLADLLNNYEQRFEDWAEHVSVRWASLLHWYEKLPTFWTSSPLNMARIPRLTRAFVEAWFNLVFADQSLIKLIDDQTACQLIHYREVQLKRQRARLENPRALERWPGHSGDRQLEYRWSVANTFAGEILAGLQTREADDA